MAFERDIDTSQVGWEATLSKQLGLEHRLDIQRIQQEIASKEALTAQRKFNMSEKQWVSNLAKKYQDKYGINPKEFMNTMESLYSDNLRAYKDMMGRLSKKPMEILWESRDQALALLGVTKQVFDVDADAMNNLLMTIKNEYPDMPMAERYKLIKIIKDNLTTKPTSRP